MKKPLVNCPQCGRTSVWSPENRYRPFCSERCKMIDLGQWAAESYRIPDTEKGAEEQENDQKEK
ncbi:MAG: DNA gyrase inhibitor YacG [Nitrosospira sp.]